MKTLHVPFEDKEYNKLKKKKGELTWKEFLLKLINNTEEKHYARA
jgi:hypothetical protein